MLYVGAVGEGYGGAMGLCCQRWGTIFRVVTESVCVWDTLCYIPLDRWLGKSYRVVSMLGIVCVCVCFLINIWALSVMPW